SAASARARRRTERTGTWLMRSSPDSFSSATSVPAPRDRPQRASRRGPGWWYLSPMIPDGYLDLFTGKKAFASLATVMPDGSPQVPPVGFDYADGKVRINTARGRVKDRNMTKNARVALDVMDPDNPYRHVQIRGYVAK